MALINYNRCALCLHYFSVHVLRSDSYIVIDLKRILGSLWDASYPERLDAPLCEQCARHLEGDLRYISIHPDDLPQLRRAKPLERLTDGSAGLLGIPVVVDDTIPPGKVELRYSGKTRSEVVAEYEHTMALVDRLNSKE